MDNGLNEKNKKMDFNWYLVNWCQFGAKKKSVGRNRLVKWQAVVPLWKNTFVLM